jgi:dTDP-4-dehydrorhamnose reductase
LPAQSRLKNITETPAWAFIFSAGDQPMSMKVLVTGGSGYLGYHLLLVAARYFDLFASYRGSKPNLAAGKPIFLDLTRQHDVYRDIYRLRPEAIIHAAAVNPGQGDEDLMMTINSEGSRVVARAAAAVGARLVHISTDVVHDGRHAPYDDDAPPNPINAYGRSKAAAELVVMEECPLAALVRTSLIYGLDIMDRGTAGFKAKVDQGEALALFTDVIRQPVWVNSLVDVLIKLVNSEFSGLLNVAGQQPVTRECFGKKLLAYWQVDTGRNLTSGRAADISNTIPLDLRLTTDRVKALLHVPLPGVDAVLKSHARGSKE